MAKYNVLRIDSSARSDGSVSRTLVDRMVEKLDQANELNSLVSRDLSKGIDFVSEEWISANFTDEAERSAEQRSVLAKSDELVAELEAADLLVIGMPIYNFGIPAALKAWVDMVARARKTFMYTENGPVGLLKNKKAVILAASGGTEVGSDIDFATAHLKFVLGFIGIHDVEIIAADKLMADPEKAIARANARIDGYFVQQAA